MFESNDSTRIMTIWINSSSHSPGQPPTIVLTISQDDCQWSIDESRYTSKCQHHGSIRWSGRWNRTPSLAQIAKFLPTDRWFVQINLRSNWMSTEFTHGYRLNYHVTSWHNGHCSVFSTSENGSYSRTFHMRCFSIPNVAVLHCDSQFRPVPIDLLAPLKLQRKGRKGCISSKADLVPQFYRRRDRRDTTGVE